MLRKPPPSAATCAPVITSSMLHRQAAVSIDTSTLSAHQFVPLEPAPRDERSQHWADSAAAMLDEPFAPTKPLAEAFAEDAALLGIEPMAGRGLGQLRRSARCASRLALGFAALITVVAVVSAVELVRLLAQH